MTLQTPARVLLVEDEEEILQLMALHLRRADLEVETAVDGDRAAEILQRRSFDLIVLDWMLPGMSGLELTRWLRRSRGGSRVPVLFVTAKTDPEHVVIALGCGADDYIPKPFDTMEFMARVQALLRRARWMSESSAEPDDSARLAGLYLNRGTHEAVMDGDPLALTRCEFLLLYWLIKAQGKVMSRRELIDRIQGDEVHVSDRTVDTHVFGLRRKLGAYGAVIEAVRGVGYRVSYPNGKSSTVSI